MEYEIYQLEVFTRWFKKLDKTTKQSLSDRLVRVGEGNLGDYKALGAELFELRCFFGGGIRVYFTIRNQQIIILLAGGSKHNQDADISKARAILETLED